MSIMEWIAAILGVIAVVLTIKQKWWCWPIGIINVFLYIFVFFEAKLYADMGLQVVYILLQLYGWYMWTKKSGDGEALIVTRASNQLMAVMLFFIVIFGSILGFTLGHRTDAALPYWDSSITAMSLAAQYLQSIKKIENWALWVVVNILSVGVFAVKGLYPTSLLYAIFLGLALMGWREWHLSLKKIAAPTY